MFRRDYIQRQIARLGEALARLAGLRSQRDLDAAQQELSEAYRILNLDPTFLRLDARSLAALVGDPERVAMLARLLEEEALLRELEGNEAEARQKRRLAAALEEWVAGRKGA